MILGIRRLSEEGRFSFRKEVQHAVSDSSSGGAALTGDSSENQQEG